MAELRPQSRAAFLDRSQRLALAYLGFGLAWVIGSDALLFALGKVNPDLLAFQLLKGSAFAVLSAFAVFLLLRYLSGERRLSAFAPGLNRFAAAASGGYLVVGLAVVFGMDYYLYLAGVQNGDFMYTQWLKGSAFVGISAFLVFLLARLPADTDADYPARRHASATSAGWEEFPIRVALVFGLVLLGLSLVLDIYEFAVTREIGAGQFREHVIESLLLTAFAGLTLYALLRYVANQASRTLAGKLRSEQRYHSLFAHNPSGVCLVDREGRFIEANRAACELFGLELDELLGGTFEPLIEPDQLEEIRQQFQSALRGEPRHYEAMIRRPDGELLQFEVTNVPRYENGEVAGVYGVFRDVTLERTYADRISASEARFRALFEHSPDAVMLTRPDGAIEAANPAAQAMLGMSEAEIARRGRDGIVDTADPTLAGLLAERERTGRTRGILRYRRADGTTFPVEITSARFDDAEGNARSFVIAQDVSERKRFEAALSASEARHRAVFEHSMEGLLLLNSDGGILGANPAAREIFRMSEDELKAKGRTGITDQDDPAVHESIAERQSTGRSRAVVRMIRGDGERFSAEISAVQFRSADGEDLVSVAVRDVTEQREREAQLASSEARYRELYHSHPDAVLELDPEGRITQVNDAVARLVGYAPGELIGGSFDHLLHPEDLPRAWEHFRAVVGGETRSFKVRGVRENGQVFWAQVIGVPRHERGTLVGAAGIVRDIDAEFRARKDLEDSEARYRILYEQSPDAVLLVDAETGVNLDANPAAEALFGLARDELIGRIRMSDQDIGDPAFREFVATRHREGRARGVLRLRRGDGDDFPADVISTTFHSREDRLLAITTIRDISEQVRREAELRASEERYRALFEESIDAIFISDAETRVVVAANPAAQSLFLLGEPEICARPAEQALDLDDPATAEYFRTRERDGQARARLRMRRGDDTWFSAEVTSRLFRTADGRLMANTIIRDITEQEEYERQITESEERFRIVADNTGQAIYEIDLESGDAVWAGACQAMFGFGPEELGALSPGQRLLHVPESERDRVAATYSQAAKEGGSFHLEYPLVTRDGREIRVEDWGIVLKERGRIYGVIQDVTEQHRLTRELEERERALSEVSRVQQAILDALPAHIALLGDDGEILYVNAAWRRFARNNGFLGSDAGVGSNYLTVCNGARGREADTALATARGIRQVMEGLRERFGIEYSCHSRDERHWFRLAVTPFHSGERTGAVVAHVDVSDRREAERQLELVAAAFRSADEAMLICNANFEILDVNHAYERITGRSRDDAIGNRPLFLEIEQQERNIRRALQAEGQWHGELLQRRQDGKVFVSRAAVNEVEVPESREPHLVVNFEDISELREYERKVDYLSYHDTLTGLPNRLALAEWFHSKESRDEAAESVSPMIIAYVDLDRLKTVNDAYGHKVGDELITEMGRRLRELCEEDDYVARLIGDEFVMVVSHVPDMSEALQVVRRRMARLIEPMKRGDFIVHPTVCAGIALAPEHGSSLEDLLRKADVAMHEAKRQGRGEVVLFSAGMTEEVEQQLLIERQLRSGIDNREFLLHYQPSVRLESGQVMGLEALVRWENPELGLVPPSRFIPVAEDSGLIIDLGDWVFEEVCRQIEEWRTADIPFGWVAVNLSPIQFQDPELLTKVRASMERHGIRGRQLRVEITENVLVMDPNWTIRVLGELRELDIQIAVDDFGTGYSSLAYLKRFPVDFVKLDKTFVAGLPDDAADASIVGSVIELARRLGMRVVAEGIERETQLQFLRDAGCQEAQGYYFSLPLRADDIPWLLRSHRRLPVSSSKPGKP